MVVGENNWFRLHKIKKSSKTPPITLLFYSGVRSRVPYTDLVVELEREMPEDVVERVRERRMRARRGRGRRRRGGGRAARRRTDGRAQRAAARQQHAPRRRLARRRQTVLQPRVHAARDVATNTNIRLLILSFIEKPLKTVSFYFTNFQA